MSSIPLISFGTGTVYGTWIQHLLCHSTTLKTETIRSISTLNQQLSNVEQTHIRCFLHSERWTVKGRVSASALRSYRNITYSGRVKETVAMVEELSDL